LVNPSSSLAEISAAIERYRLLAGQGIELTEPRENWFRVALIRRILSDQLRFVQVAKQFINISDFVDFMHRVIFPADSHGKLGGKSSSDFSASSISNKKVKRPVTARTSFENIRNSNSKKTETERILVENFVALQRVMTNLSVKFDNLSSQISKLLELFEISAKALAEKNPSFGGKEINKKIDNLLEQNKLIARGLTLMHEKEPKENMNSYQTHQMRYEPDKVRNMNNEQPTKFNPLPRRKFHGG